MNSNNIWIRLYKALIYISAGIIMLFGLGFALDTSSFGEFLIIFSFAALVAALDLTIGMLIATFFENIQAIRDKFEQMH